LQLQQSAGNAAVAILLGRAKAVQRQKLPVQRRELKVEATPMEGDDVKHVQEQLKKLGVADDKGVEVAVPQTGKFDAGTGAAVKAFQRSRGLPGTGVVDDATVKAIDVATTAVSKAWSEKIGGKTYGMTSKYDYQVTDKQVHVTVRFKFSPSTAFDVAPHVQRWFATIRAQWNLFKVTKKGNATVSRDIVFEPQSVSAGEHNVVNVINGTGTHNGLTWYTTYANGEAQNNLGAAHEFGHHLGLPDEYQQSHTDYRATVGGDPFPATDPLPAHADAAGVATKIKEAMALASKHDRATKLAQLFADKGVAEGRYAMLIADEYKTATSKDVVDDFYANLPADQRDGLIAPFLATAGGLMGSRYKSMDAPGSKDAAGHQHPLAPRHMAPFVAAVKAALGGDWEATFR
jgi:peptidoglycan hydrolase-like protein with peptidoglycan-binding domain